MSIEIIPFVFHDALMIFIIGNAFLSMTLHLLILLVFFAFFIRRNVCLNLAINTTYDLNDFYFMSFKDSYRSVTFLQCEIVTFDFDVVKYDLKNFSTYFLFLARNVRPTSNEKRE